MFEYASGLPLRWYVALQKFIRERIEFGTAAVT